MSTNLRDAKGLGEIRFLSACGLDPDLPLVHTVGAGERDRSRSAHAPAWESRGLPSYGAGPTKRYPVPHAISWIHAYRGFRAQGHRVEYLPMDIAFGENARANAMITSGRALRLS